MDRSKFLADALLGLNKPPPPPPSNIMSPTQMVGGAPGTPSSGGNGFNLDALRALLKHGGV